MYMKKAIGVLAVLAFFVGCGCQQNEEEGNVVDGDFTGDSVMYSCQGEEISAVFSEVEGGLGAVQMTFINRDNARIALSQVESVSGARYSDGSVVFWVADNQAMLMVEGEESSLECETMDAQEESEVTDVPEGV